MHERLVPILRLRNVRLKRPLLLLVGAIVGFLIVVAVGLEPPDPESRLPGSQRLTALIQRQSDENEQQRAEVEALRMQIEAARGQIVDQNEEANSLNDEIGKVGLSAGLVAMKGEGFSVTLDDSSLEVSPTGDVNDLVIHSQDLRAVINGLWGAGAEAISINGQRVVSTSAVLCVGNTLLVNGTVHSPPYEIAAIGADRSDFLNDPLVAKLREDAQRFSLKVAVSGEKQLTVPEYSGTTASKYAEVIS